MKKRKLLLVSYLFPPAGGIAVQRALSLAKYLPRHNFEVHVLTARNAAVPVMDPGLMSHVPDSVCVHGSFTPELPFHWRHKIWNLLSRTGKINAPRESSAGGPAAKPSLIQRLVRRILCPEPEVLWVPFALRKARRVIRQSGIEAVLITAPPFSAFLLGIALKKEFPQLKLISDFRDEWLDFYLKDFEFQGGEHTRLRAAKIEREAVECSDLVVAVTSTTLDRIRRRYPAEPESKFACIHNGYDPDVFAGFRHRQHGTGRVVVTHMGTAYKTASPRYYLDAMDELPNPWRQTVETRFIGRITEAERALMSGRKSTVRMLGFLPQSEAIGMVEETDYLLLTMTDNISLPGKLFEYLAMRKPVLALCEPGSEVDRLLRATGGGLSADYRDPHAIGRMLIAACEAARDGRRLASGNDDAISRFERPRLAAEYGERIQRLLAGDGVDEAVTTRFGSFV